jgi:Sec-independent protein secretion pathway component TatC
MLIAPPDVFSCLLIFFPLYILFEISVAISGRAVKARKLRELKRNAMDYE